VIGRPILILFEVYEAFAKVIGVQTRMVVADWRNGYEERSASYDALAGTGLMRLKSRVPLAATKKAINY